MHTRFVSRLLLLSVVAVGTTSLRPSPPRIPRVTANENRVPAGKLSHDTLTISLVLQEADWYPEAEDGPHARVEAFGEDGKIPSVPSPLIRVREGTVIHATIRNTLHDSTAHVIGLGTHPVAITDTIHIAPGARAEVTFVAGMPGTYLYRANIGKQGSRRGDPERTTSGGAFIVDPIGGSPPDRVFVLNIVNYDIDSTHFKEALGINGKSWPYTERVKMTVGDSLHWRVINGTIRGHPMHLHGFYFRTTAIGNGIADRPVPDDQQFLAVTESYQPWGTRDLVWSPDRPGNWLFHCHLSFHVVPDSRMDHTDAQSDETHSPDPMKHMAGLVMGLSVAPRPGDVITATPMVKKLDLYFQEGAARGRAPVTYSYILQHGPSAPAPDSIVNPGTLLIFNKGDAADVLVHNRTHEPAGVHWHGIELLSWSDGVVGWSNHGNEVAPAIMPGKTFTAHLLLPRAGTFIYHTHMNDIEQVTGGAAGSIIVLDAGEKFDPTRDHIYTTLWNGNTNPAALLINGDSTTAPPLTIDAGVMQRFRIVNMGPAGIVQYTLTTDGKPVEWRRRAKDGADLPTGLRIMAPAQMVVNVGETYDYEYLPTTPGHLTLTAGFNGGPIAWRQEIIIR